jgi:hypothetical protein
MHVGPHRSAAMARSQFTVPPDPSITCPSPAMCARLRAGPARRRSGAVGCRPDVHLPGSGGDERTRTADPLLAKQVLYQLSYVPVFACGITKPGPCTPRPQLITVLHPIDGSEMRDEGTSNSTGQRLW